MKSRAAVLLRLLAAAPAACGSPSEPASAPVAPPPPPVAAAPVTPPAPEEAVPTLRLPSDARPTAEAIEIHVDPARDRFSGKVDIDVTLDHARSVVWLHGKGLNVTRATATPVTGAGGEVAGTWRQRHDSGTASVTFPQALAAGHVKLRLEYDAPWSPKLEGLYKVVQAGVPYAFTQFESIAAREAFPCFDEPGFKIPFDTTLVVPAGSQAIANTREIERRTDGSALRVHFAPTLPIPSYLVAFAVGPLDVVAAPDVPPNAVRTRPLPLRAVTVKGRGKDSAYALAHAGEILATLEKYFGLEYPYDKLDIIAAPDTLVSMENPGAVVFGDGLILLDEKTAPLSQKRAYASVVAHEFAHQWVGDLVTAAWWDDIWLNEAFATWVGAEAADAWDPKSDAATELLSGVQGAISSDILVSARSIRQPIESTDDIENAFDAITYQKGGGVLSMFERWLGREAFQRGVREYLAAHKFGSATADDFLSAESKATGKDVKTPFHTFLDQPGVPFVEAELRCDGAPRLHLKQSRYLPLGSHGDANKSWQIPICARYQAGEAGAAGATKAGGAVETKEACTLLTETEGDLPLAGACPEWVFPNSDAAGYFRFSLAAADLARIRKKGFEALSARERVAYANSLRAAFGRGTIPMKEVILASLPLASDPHKEVAGEPMGFLVLARDWLFADPLRLAVEEYARTLFHDEGMKLGWTPGKNDDSDKVQLRGDVLGFLAMTAEDPAVRAEAKRRGLAFLGYPKRDGVHPAALDPNVAAVALSVVGQEADRPLWDYVHGLLAKTDDAELRGKLLGVLVSARSADLLPAVRGLVFDPALKASEVTAPIWAQLGENWTRDAAWAWLKENFDKVLAAVPKHPGQTQLVSMGGVFCDEAHAKDVESFFTPARIAEIDGAPRVLASTIEDLRVCAAKRAVQEPSAREMFGKQAKR